MFNPGEGDGEMPGLFETDPIALGILFLAILLGVCVSAFVFFATLEEGLRRRRSPNQVRLEAAACGVITTAAIGTFATWGLLIFLGLVFIAVLLLLGGRGLHRWSVVVILIALAIVAAVLLTHLHSPRHNETRSNSLATSPSQTGSLIGPSSANAPLGASNAASNSAAPPLNP